MKKLNPSHQELPLWLVLSYAMPNLAIAAAFLPIAVHLNKHYVDNLGVPSAQLAFAIAVARAVDLLVDPVVGWASDATESVHGRRRPWIAVGAPLLAVVYVCLFSPPQGLSPTSATVWFALFYALWGLIPLSLPHHSLGPELTQDYHERSRLFAHADAFTMAGTLIGSVTPGVFSHLAKGNERYGYMFMSFFNAALIVVLFEWMVVVIKESGDFRPAKVPIIPGLRRTMRNGPFRLLLAVFVIDSISAFSVASLLPFFVQYVLAPPNHEFWLSVFLLVYFSAHLVAIPFFVALARMPRFGKRGAWLIGWGIALPAWALGLLLRKGDVYPYMVLLFIGGFAGGSSFLNFSIKADVIDYDELCTGKRREAVYLAFWEMVPKLIAIPGASLPFVILGWAGYRSTAQEQTASVVLAIRLLIVLLPFLCNTMAFCIALFFPVTHALHKEILEGIERHSRGLSAFDSISARVIRPPVMYSAEDEEAIWTLDNFSVNDLKSLVQSAGGGGMATSRLALRTTLWTALSAALFGVSVAAVVVTAKRDLGAFSLVPMVVACSVLWAATVFNAMRIVPARKLEGGAVSKTLIMQHLDSLE
jgi:GPH family glycoside/pentoside/hexuronide:cation symporter